MSSYECPRCGETSISRKAKYLAGKWSVIHCPRCGARLCAYPLLLAGFYVLYVWDVMWFMYMWNYTGNAMHLVYMVLVWVVIDFFNMQLMPLASMKPKPKD